MEELSIHDEFNDVDVRVERTGRTVLAFHWPCGDTFHVKSAKLETALAALLDTRVDGVEISVTVKSAIRIAGWGSERRYGPLTLSPGDSRKTRVHAYSANVDGIADGAAGASLAAKDLRKALALTRN